MALADLGDNSPIGAHEGTQRIDLAAAAHAHLNHNVESVGIGGKQRVRHAELVVLVAARSRNAPCACEHVAHEVFGGCLTVRTGKPHNPTLQAPAPYASEIGDGGLRVIHKKNRRPELLHAGDHLIGEGPRDEHAARARGNGGEDVVVPVDSFTCKRNIERALAGSAGIPRNGRNLSIRVRSRDNTRRDSLCDFGYGKLQASSPPLQRRQNGAQVPRAQRRGRRRTRPRRLQAGNPHAPCQR